MCVMASTESMTRLVSVDVMMRWPWCSSSAAALISACTPCVMEGVEKVRSKVAYVDGDVPASR